MLGFYDNILNIHFINCLFGDYLSTYGSPPFSTDFVIIFFSEFASYMFFTNCLNVCFVYSVILFTS